MYSLFDDEVRTQRPLDSGGYEYAHSVSHLTSALLAQDLSILTNLELG